MRRNAGILVLLAGGYVLPLLQRAPVWPAWPLWCGLALMIGLVITRRAGLPFARRDQDSAAHGTVMLAAAISMILPVIEWRVRGFPGAIVPNVGQYLGIALALSGIQLRVSSRRHSGAEAVESWSPSGPYRLVRFPDHTGGLLVIVGHALAYAALLSACLSAALMLLTYAQHIRARDGELDAAYGRAYAHYRARTYRLVPKVW